MDWMIFDEAQQAIANKIENDKILSNWRSLKWQLKHAIRLPDQFELLTGIRFDIKERKGLEKIFKKFPLSITPYCLSLINTKNFRNDPVYHCQVEFIAHEQDLP